MNKDIRMGMEIQEIIMYGHKLDEISQFLKGEIEFCFWFSDLKPLYDEFGYTEVNNCILEIASARENEQTVKQDDLY